MKIPEFQLTGRIERISPAEIYLIDVNGTRARRVCGSTSTPSGRACFYESGYRTDHYGRGLCFLHDNPTSSAIWGSILGTGQVANSKLVQYLENTAVLGDNQLRSVDADIAMLYALVGLVQDGKIQLLASDIDMIKDIIQDIGKLKGTRAKLERETKFEVNAIKEFIDQIFRVITSQLDASTARRLMGMILEKVIMPMESANSFSGDSKELHASVSHHRQAALEGPKRRRSYTPESE